MLTTLALAGAFLTALSSVYTSRLLKANPFGSVLCITLCHAAMLPLFLIFHPPAAAYARAVSAHVMDEILIGTFLIFVSRLLYTYAYAHIDVVRVAIFSLLTPILTLGTAYMMLGEVVTLLQFTGMIVIMISGACVLFTGDSSEDSSKHTKHAVLFAFLSTLPSIFSPIYQKEALLSLPLIDVLAIQFLLISMFGLLPSVWSVARNSVLVKEIAIHWKDWLIIGGLILAANACFFRVMYEQPVASAQAAQRLSLLFQLLLSYFILKEKSQFWGRIAFCGVGIAGVIIMLQPTS